MAGTEAYEQGELDGLEIQGRTDRRYWNRIPDSDRSMIVNVALERPDITPRELSWHITGTHDYFVSESSVYRILKAHDLITNSQFMVMCASDKFQHPTRRVHELWQTEMTPLTTQPALSGLLCTRGGQQSPLHL